MDELSKKNDNSGFKFIVNSSGLESNFSEVKAPIAFLDSIKKRKISIEESRYKQEKFDRYLKK